jgi:hypothetical protein
MLALYNACAFAQSRSASESDQEDAETEHLPKGGGAE